MAVDTDRPLGAALHYARLGYRVLPVCPRGKVPLLPHWPTEASTEPEVLRHWFTRQYPRANLALVTEGLLVVDLDSGYDQNFVNGERSAAIRELRPPVQRTPRGGYHIVFRRPDGVPWRCSAGRLAQGVDIKTDGGCILVAPSVTKDGRYRWARPLVPRPQLPLPPQWLVDELDRLYAPPPPRPERKCSPPRSTPGLGRRFIPKRIRELTPVGIGGRHNTLLSCLAAYRAAGADDDEIEAMAYRINYYCLHPPLEDSECQRIVDWICRKPQGLGVDHGRSRNH